MTTWRSSDGHWQVRTISLNGRELLRIEHDTPVMPVSATHGRVGPTQGPGGWWLQEDVATSTEVERYVPLAELEENQ